MMISIKSPRLISACLGTGTTRSSLTRMIWLPFCLSILKSTLPRALTTSRHERRGSFDNHYDLFSSGSLLELFRLDFQVTFNRFLCVTQSFVPCLALGGHGELNTFHDEASFFGRFQDHCESQSSQKYTKMRTRCPLAYKNAYRLLDVLQNTSKISMQVGLESCRI